MFVGLDDDTLACLADHAYIKTYHAGVTIFNENDAGGAMFIVQAGKVELFTKDRAHIEVQLLIVEAGNVFGELSLLDNRPRSASARTLTETEFMVIERDALIDATHKNPTLAVHLLELMSKRLRATTVLVQERVVPNANEMIEVKLTFGDRLSDFFTSFSGNLYFVFFSIVWFVLWIAWNMGALPGVEPFDPFPFGLLTMIVSLEMVFLSLFILIKQARQAANDKVRNDIEYEVNLRAEMGVRNLAQQLDALERRMMQRFDQQDAYHRQTFERLVVYENGHLDVSHPAKPD